MKTWHMWHNTEQLPVSFEERKTSSNRLELPDSTTSERMLQPHMLLAITLPSTTQGLLASSGSLRRDISTTMQQPAEMTTEMLKTTESS